MADYCGCGEEYCVGGCVWCGEGVLAVAGSWLVGSDRSMDGSGRWAIVCGLWIYGCLGGLVGGLLLALFGAGSG